MRILRFAATIARATLAGVIENGIPNSRRVVVEDAGHLMYLEKPDEFSRIVLAFLQANQN